MADRSWENYSVIVKVEHNRKSTKRFLQDENE